MNAPVLNPRFLAYAQSRDMTPEQVVVADRVAFPGGRMAGFLAWNTSQIAAFLAETGVPRFVVSRHGPYDDWLATRLARGQLELRLETV